MRYNGDKKQKAIADKWQIFSYRQKNNIALFLALLFHACGAIGILFTPYKQWFVSNTPVNLLLMTALLVFTQKEKNLPFYFFILLCYATGMITEIIGVNTGYLFGRYAYGRVLGPKLFGVPWIIGTNWFIAVFCSANIVFRLNEWVYKKLSSDMRPSLIVQLFSFVFDAALLATLFDYILEPSAVQFGFWKWLPKGAIPIYNFVCWFIISAALLTAFRLLKFNKHNQFAIHLLIIQVLFFLVLQTFS
ncbi:MAG TPA: carotenoid biosynthesis protein [Chitinophagaceae bacterium]|nr:carotenoid biosynthesis protein [Chitinophagaceae bacterium]